MIRKYRLHAQVVDPEMYTIGTPPPPGTRFKVIEVLARDPERDIQYWCSPIPQQKAECIRYEVIVEHDDPAVYDEAHEWGGELEMDFMRGEDNVDRLFGSRTFDDWPYVERDVEVPDSTIDELDPDDRHPDSFAVEMLFIRQLQEDEHSPTDVPLRRSEGGTDADE